MKKLAILILAIVSLFCSVSAHAGTVAELNGEVVMVRPCSDGVSEVFVTTDDGELYSYYADGDVYTGRVYILLIDGEIADVINYAELSSPFAF